jgi:hypothetical protein
MRSNTRQTTSLRWQYFMSLYGVHIEYPAHKFDSATANCIRYESLVHRMQFMHAALPYAKRVVVVVDVGKQLFIYLFIYFVFV